MYGALRHSRGTLPSGRPGIPPVVASVNRGATEADQALTEKLRRELDQEKERVAELQGQLERTTMLTDGEASSSVLSSRANRLTMCLGEGAIQVGTILS